MPGFRPCRCPGLAAGAQPAEGAAAAPGAKPAPPTSEDLLAGTLAKDISTASYYELVTWCDAAGARRHRVAERPAGAARAALLRDASEGPAAREANRDGQVRPPVGVLHPVRVRGEVRPSPRRRGGGGEGHTDGTLQVIKAGSLTFNQTRRTMSAVGDVTYTLTTGGPDRHVHRAEPRLRPGQLRGGVLRRQHPPDGQDDPATTCRTPLPGKTITRVRQRHRHSSEWRLHELGDAGRSAVPDPGRNRLAAGARESGRSRTRCCSSGGCRSSTCPGFFWPGDDFFFNPNVGYRPREGSFLQTTTYLIGRKAKQDSPFSFLQLSGSGDTGYALEPHGLFLRKMPGVTAAEGRRAHAEAHAGRLYPPRGHGRVGRGFFASRHISNEPRGEHEASFSTRRTSSTPRTFRFPIRRTTWATSSGTRRPCSACPFPSASEWRAR